MQTLLFDRGAIRRYTSKNRGRASTPLPSALPPPSALVPLADANFLNAEESVLIPPMYYPEYSAEEK